MKKKIIIVVSIFSLLFSLGGVYIIVSIEKTTSDLEKLIMLHQVEILREHLLIQIKRVQSDLSIRHTRYAKGFNTVVTDVTIMKRAAESCFSCHHADGTRERLKDLEDQIHNYRDALSRVTTIRANAERLKSEEDNAYIMGEKLIESVKDMMAMAGSRLEEKTQHALTEINATKRILFVLIISGPFIATILMVIFVKGFTKPIQLLLDATKTLKEGDMDYRIVGLKDEFGVLASSFNEMAGSLKEQMYRVEESEKRYRMLFESARDAIFIMEAEGRNAGKIVAANEAAAAMHGYTVDELLTMHIGDLDTPDIAKDIPDRIRRIVNGEWIKDEITHLRKDGTIFPVEISAGLLELSDHKYVLAIDRDVTERKQAEEQLLRTEQMVVCGEVATGLAHEIKNPLAGIKASIELFSGISTLPEDDRNILQKVIGEIKRIELLLKGILNYAKPPKPDFSSVDINSLLDTALTFSLNPSFAARNSRAAIQVVKDFDDLLPQIIADPMQLSQVFLNLFLNAVESMNNGGTLTVKTSYNTTRNSIWINISDTGKGIESELMNQIFNPFFTTKSKGTGLGLPITKRLIEQHGGVLACENNPSGGATFTISLPVKQKEKALSA
ncbi:MAG: PAS domain S-box protein [Nitrospirae bacterium]|nr:PAS domain S-box protein [Nitrospirota bacterium]